MEPLLPPQPGPSSSKAIQHGAEQSWTNPITNKAAESPQQALQNDPRKHPVNPRTLENT